jgi:hypothetical protein
MTNEELDEIDQRVRVARRYKMWLEELRRARQAVVDGKVRHVSLCLRNDGDEVIDLSMGPVLSSVPCVGKMLDAWIEEIEDKFAAL